ncbi:MAG: zinc ABC transporter substrate-binding protein [Pseudomonadota bacterium]
MKQIAIPFLALSLGVTPVLAAPKLVATVGMIGEPAAHIADGCADVQTMMGPGIDPHLYQASAGDVRDLFEAAGVLYAGHNLEGQLGEIFAKLGATKPVLAVSEAAAPKEQLILEDGAPYADPHLWMDALLWSGIAAPIADVLAGLDPACANAPDRAETYQAELAALDSWIRASVATIPETQRVMVTAHDAFAYYGRAYGIEVVGIQGVSTESEAAIADIRATVDLVVERNVPAIFVESTINPRTVEAVIEAADAEGHRLIRGEELFSDAMGEEGTASGTYIGMLYSNTVSVVEALGGELQPLPTALHPWAERWGIALDG